MKNRHLSAFMLAAGNVVYKALIVSLAAAAVQLALLFWQAGSATSFQAIFDVWPDRAYYLGAAVLYALLWRSGVPKGGVNPEYSYRMLRISETGAALWQALANALCFVVYQGFILAARLGFTAIYMKDPAVPVNEMSLFFAAYGNRGLHYLLPLEDWATLGLGDAPARDGLYPRRGRGHGPRLLLGEARQGLGLCRDDAGLHHRLRPHRRRQDVRRGLRGHSARPLRGQLHRPRGQVSGRARGRRAPGRRCRRCAGMSCSRPRASTGSRS